MAEWINYQQKQIFRMCTQYQIYEKEISPGKKVRGEDEKRIRAFKRQRLSEEETKLVHTTYR